jgi:hypothetical protein
MGSKIGKYQEGIDRKSREEKKVPDFLRNGRQVQELIPKQTRALVG